MDCWLAFQICYVCVVLIVVAAICIAIGILNCSKSEKYKKLKDHVQISMFNDMARNKEKKNNWLNFP